MQRAPEWAIKEPSGSYPWLLYFFSHPNTHHIAKSPITLLEKWAESQS